MRTVVGLLAGGEQLERADHVDVVQLPGPLARLGYQQDLAVDDGVDLGRRQQLREQRVADVGPDELRPLEVGGRRPHVEAGDVVDRGMRSSRRASSVPQ